MLMTRLRYFVYVQLLGLIFLCLAGCQPVSVEPTNLESAVPVAEIVVLPTQAELVPSLTPPPSFNTLTPIPTATATATPTETPTPSLTPTPTATPVDRTCPDPSPRKPDYLRYDLGESRWPTPVAGAEPHFWLDKPLPGGGRYNINPTFPYGHDGLGYYLLHNGVDSSARLGTPLLAVADGTVVVAQSDADELYGWRCNWYGELVVLELDQKWMGQSVFALYGHVLEINVEVGDKVERGDQVAEVGFGGAATVPHLHFEVRVGRNEFGSTRNPMLWVGPPESRGVIVGRVVDEQGRPWHGVSLSVVEINEGWIYNTWTYLDDPRKLINPDEGFAENFVIHDVRPGVYRVVMEIDDERYQGSVTVEGGEIGFVEVVID